MGCVNQNHNKYTMKGKKITSCVVISSTLQQLRTELLEKGCDLQMLLKVAYLDADVVLVAVEKKQVFIAGPIQVPPVSL